MRDRTTPYGSPVADEPLPLDGMIDELTGTIAYSEVEGSLTITVQVFPITGKTMPVLTLLTPLFTEFMRKVCTLDVPTL